VSDAPQDILKVAYEGEIAVMTMNNPKRLNAFNWAMRSAMYERLLEIEANESCRAIVLQGAGGNLCAGGDISEMKHREILEARARMDLPTRIFKLLVNGPKPFICAVEGNAAGASASTLAELAGLIADGQLEVPIAATFPLSQVQDAYRRLASGHNRGKIVLTV